MHAESQLHHTPSRFGRKESILLFIFPPVLLSPPVLTPGV